MGYHIRSYEDLDYVVKKASKCIYKSFSNHVYGKFKEGDSNYIYSGINDDIDIYENFFLLVLGEVLGIDVEWRGVFPEPAIQETVEVIKRSIRKEKLSRVLKNPLIAECIFVMIMTVFEEIKKKYNLSDYKVKNISGWF